MEDSGKLIKQASRRLRQGTGAPDFFELVRRIERNRTDFPRLGKAVRPAQENVRFGQMPYLRFPATEIAEITPSAGDVEALIITYFFGLLGVNGPMPLEFTNYVFQRSHNYYDQSWRRFLDIVHHRFATLFYRAWAMNEQAVSFDRPDDDPVTDIVRALAGTPPDMPTANADMPYLTANYASHFGSAVKSRSSLEAILRGVLKIDLKIRDHVTASYDIPAEARCQLGNRDTAVVGRNMQLGRAYLSSTREFEILIGPVSFAECRKWLPGADGFDRIGRVVMRYLDKPLDYTIKFTIDGDTVPLAALGDPASARLGRGCWLGRSRDREKDMTLTIGASRLNKKRHKASFQQKGIRL
ncbi:MAG TPA: type VI secretion system baseplate subunit TssG [Alphaproteobacteria bacterium]|nr:type VI secretion system baseplate subunit TssG [Alphaproteobacteria bacterium]